MPERNGQFICVVVSLRVFFIKGKMPLKHVRDVLDEFTRGGSFTWRLIV